MKKNILSLGIFLALISFTACTTESESNNEDLDLARLQADVAEITNMATTGPWTITNFVDSGKNETGDFSGYGFSFNADGSLVADNGTTTITGSWSITIDDDTSDDNSDDSSGDSQDHDCDSCTIEQLTDVLTACSDWFVEKLERNTNNLEDNYSGYLFNFMADGSLMVTSSTDSYNGSWTASGSGNNIQVVLTVTDLADFEDTWTLHEIELYQGESNVDLRINGEDRLRFRNNCTLGDFGGGNTTGEIDFNIFFAAPEDFAELTEDWNIISYSATKIELKHVSGGDGDIDLLTFEK
ncbi:hypothetical protein [Lentiprolixibacter aurantiacus]|uniref:DUF4465 domain-containing protein n=1 Tax=Lentiprolixibacter aurantiacus TaxID=2993939 RepID=A0AAE3MMT3_9FLAO|nr:hypothetical protein [Lentiprolixibacter aurantiacus]MCX2720333.1 hypothetical protein [Lentiprolixibacter aurantiacus]